MNQKHEAIDICLSFSNEIFHNPEVTNIIVRIESDLIPKLKEQLEPLDFHEKRRHAENKKCSIINFEKIYPFYS